MALDGARRYFEALASDEGDYGWSLIDRTGGWTDYDAYEKAVRSVSAQLDGFDVAATETIRCDEGYACRVCLELADPDATPEFLRSSDGKALDGIIVFDDPLPCGNAMIFVGLDPWTGGLDGIGIVP